MNPILVLVVQKNMKRRIQNIAKHLKWPFFAKIVNGFQPVTVFSKLSILYIWVGFECASQL